MGSETWEYVDRYRLGLAPAADHVALAYLPEEATAEAEDLH